MSRVVALALVVVCAGVAQPEFAQVGMPPMPPPQLLGTPRPAQPSATPALFEQLLADYAGGDRDVLDKTLTTSKAVFDFHQSLMAALQAKDDPKLKKPWTRARPVFLLEVANYASIRFRQDVVPCVSAGRLMVMGRPALLGADASEDAFEGLWHRVALAILQRRLADDAQEVYLDTLERRYLTGPNAQTTKALFDPHFALDRVIAGEQTAFRLDGLTPGQVASTRLTTLAKPKDGSKLAVALKTALKASDEAIALPDVAIEANLRRATLQIELGQFAEALASTRVPNRAQADNMQRYWLTLLEARALHELKQLPEAERAYRDAAAQWPDAPMPATGIALVLFDMNRREDAVAAAAAVRAMTSNDSDPWWGYLAADARFVAPWLNQLRGMLP